MFISDSHSCLLNYENIYTKNTNKTSAATTE